MPNIDELKEMARKIRVDVIDSVYAAKSGHPGGSLSAAEIIAALYFYKLRVNPKNPEWEDRDRFILSKGHAAPALYSALARKGFFPISDLKRFRQVDSHLQGAPNMKTPGVDMSSGPLGQGLSAAVGMALGARYLGKDFRTYCMMGDGEIQEGQIWEAAMAADKFKLANLIGILDYNKVQMSGTNEELMPLGDVVKKFEAFGWKVLRIDGNDMRQAVDALDATDGRIGLNGPAVIIADTIKGKGISYMEGLAAWHGGVPSDEQYKQAMKELGVEA